MYSSSRSRSFTSRSRSMSSDLGLHLGFERRQVLVQALGVDPRDEVRREVDDLLEALRRDVEQVAQARRDTLEVPDVRDRRRELDVAHALAPHLRARHLDAAALADDALETDALVLAAVALPVLRRTEDLLAEESVLLGLERAVVDRLRLLHLAVRPREDVARGCQVDGESVTLVHVEHVNAPLRMTRSSNERRRVPRLLRRCPVRAATSRCRAIPSCGMRPRRAPGSRSPGRPRSSRGRSGTAPASP